MTRIPRPNPDQVTVGIPAFADIDYINVECPHCNEKVWGTSKDIDSGLRKHIEYCPKAPAIWVCCDCGYQENETESTPQFRCPQCASYEWGNNNG